MSTETLFRFWTALSLAGLIAVATLGHRDSKRIEALEQQVARLNAKELQGGQ